MSDEVNNLQERIERLCRQVPGNQRISLMEVCGTHTVAIQRSGLRAVLPERIRLVSGPGCPVCVTPQNYIDVLTDLWRRPGITLATFGDMIRVPGSTTSLEEQKARGGSVHVCYSVLDALEFARRNRNQRVVFAAVGFETTAPGTACAIAEAQGTGMRNFLVLSGHKWITPAMEALLSGGETAISGFICPGHVSVIIGSGAYEPLVERFARPCVVAGFDAVQVLKAVATIVEQLAKGEARVENVYPQCVSREGNAEALVRIESVFERAPSLWRGLGEIPLSGMRIRAQYADLDADEQLEIEWPAEIQEHGCRCGDVLRGLIEPTDCPLFADRCTPAHPVGPCMVSREGSCRAYFKYGGKRDND